MLQYEKEYDTIPPRRRNVDNLGLPSLIKKRSSKKSRSRENSLLRRHHLNFGAYFNSFYRIPDKAIYQIPDETVICRCEDVTMGEIRNAIREGYHTPGAIKQVTRTGMGRCQGRTCGPILYDIISAYTRKPSKEIPLLSVRPPIKPVTFDSLIAENN
ncbi:MAG TPA: (2Fe-2S)-binding protein [Desulfatiglandales bacterium]|nr:(2Fe-2S)-binding protein [Desulfatiglandales bacterium]